MEVFTWIVLVIAVILIAIIWIIKAKTSYLYYYFAFYPELNIPVKVAWLATLIIAGVSAYIIW